MWSTRVADPVGVDTDPDSTFKNKPDPDKDPAVKKKPDPDPILEKNRDPNPTLEKIPGSGSVLIPTQYFLFNIKVKISDILSGMMADPDEVDPDPDSIFKKKPDPILTFK